MRWTGSTLARHVGIGLLALAVVGALSLALGPYRNVQLAQVAYLVCATAGLSRSVSRPSA